MTYCSPSCRGGKCRIRLNLDEALLCSRPGLAGDAVSIRGPFPAPSLGCTPSLPPFPTGPSEQPEPCCRVSVPRGKWGREDAFALLHFAFSQRVALRGGLGGPPSLSSLLGLEACLGWAHGAELWDAQEQGPARVSQQHKQADRTCQPGAQAETTFLLLSLQSEKRSARCWGRQQGPQRPPGDLPRGAGRRRAERERTEKERGGGERRKEEGRKGGARGGARRG